MDTNSELQQVSLLDEEKSANEDQFHAATASSLPPQGSTVETPPTSDAPMTEQTTHSEANDEIMEETAPTALNAAEVNPEVTNKSTTEPEEVKSKPFFCKADEQLHRFLTKLMNVKPTVPPSFTRRILHQQGVGYVDPLVPKLISTCGDKFIATILSQALICKDRRIDGEIMKKKYERERKRMNQRRQREDMEKDRRRKKKEDALKEFVHDKKKVLSEESKSILKSFTDEKKKKTKFTFDMIGEEGGIQNVDDDDIHDDVRQEEDYYNSTVQENDSPLDQLSDPKLDVNKQYLEDESDQEDEDEDEDDQVYTLQLVDIYRPLQAWGFSLAGKMGLATEPSGKKDHDEHDLEQHDEDLSDEDDFEEDEDDDHVHMDGEEKTPARKKVKIATSVETPGVGNVKRKRSVTPKSRASSSPAVPGSKKPKLSSSSTTKPSSDDKTGGIVPSTSK